MTGVPVRFAGPIDAFVYGEHSSTGPPRSTSIRQFTGRNTADGSIGHRAEPGRYHL